MAPARGATASSSRCRSTGTVGAYAYARDVVVLEEAGGDVEIVVMPRTATATTVRRSAPAVSVRRDGDGRGSCSRMLIERARGRLGRGGGWAGVLRRAIRGAPGSVRRGAGDAAWSGEAGDAVSVAPRSTSGWRSVRRGGSGASTSVAAVGLPGRSRSRRVARLRPSRSSRFGAGAVSELRHSRIAGGSSSAGAGGLATVLMGGAAGDVSGQPLGLVPVLGRGRTGPLPLVGMEVADAGASGLLLPGATGSLPVTFAHGRRTYDTINDVGYRRQRFAGD